MKYYKLEHNWNITKEIGHYPQIDRRVSLGDDYEMIEQIAQHRAIGKKWIVPELGLNDKARRTTLASNCISSLVFLILKDYFLDFLKDFNLDDCQDWPIKVHYKGGVIDDYRLFHISHPSDGKYVDFSNSEFLIGKQAIYEDQSIGKPINIENYKNYLNLLELIREEDESLYIQCPKLVLDFSNATEDMIRFAESPQAGYYVSERLRDAVLEKRFTGMDFLEIGEYSKLEVKNADNIP